MFETNLKDERLLPFEGAGAISTWNLSLPAELPAFDYTTISDVILHIRYTAREVGDPLGSQATKELVRMLGTGQSDQSLLFCLRYDFPTQWAAFVNGGDFTVTLEKRYFPYALQSATKLKIDALTLYAGSGDKITPFSPLTDDDLNSLSTGLSSATGTATLTLPLDPQGKVMIRDQTQQVFLVLQYQFGTA